MQQLTPELTAAIVAGVISLLFTYIPTLREKFAAQSEDAKKTIMGAITIVAAVAVYVLACVPALGFPYVACPTGGFWELIGTILIALGVNQGIDRISPEPASVKAVKAAAK